MTRINVPAWTPEQIAEVRKIYRANGTIEDVMNKLQTGQKRDAYRERAIALGMRFIAKGHKARAI